MAREHCSSGWFERGSQAPTDMRGTCTGLVWAWGIRRPRPLSCPRRACERSRGGALLLEALPQPRCCCVCVSVCLVCLVSGVLSTCVEASKAARPLEGYAVRSVLLSVATGDVGNGDRDIPLALRTARHRTAPHGTPPTPPPPHTRGPRWKIRVYCIVDFSCLGVHTTKARREVPRQWMTDAT